MNKEYKIPSILELVRQKSAHIFNHILEHPFVVLIHSEGLNQEQFDFYSEQDDLYLEVWVEIISGILKRLKDHSLTEDPAFIKNLDFIQNHLDTVEKLIKDGVFNPKRKENNFSPAAMIPQIAEYCEHLRASANDESIAIGLAALFGCYDLYREIGIYSKAQEVSKEHRYYGWLTANYDTEFVETAECIFGLTERIMQYELLTGILKSRDHLLDIAYLSYCHEGDFFTAAAEHNEPHRTLTP